MSRTQKRHKINVPALDVKIYTIRSAMVTANVVSSDLSIRESINNERNFNILEVEGPVKWSVSKCFMMSCSAVGLSVNENTETA